MSAQFGRWNFDGRPVDQDYLEKVTPSISPYGPDESCSYSRGSIIIHHCAFHVTRESRRETQPHVTGSGAVITWDGRLDNRGELIRRLQNVLTTNSTDLAIIAAAYEEWGTNCFAKLIGDWALSIWDPNSHSLILAKDPIGTRPLYYSFEKDHVTWSTILDPLVLFAGKTFSLCEEYIAGWFSFFPAAHLTPYVGIHSVPPSSSVLMRAGKYTVAKYWDFDSSKRIHYNTDAEYEEQFRALFTKAVQRRLRSDSPVLAELSGGLDSSSIVCIADDVIAHGTAETVRLDTISYYDDSEPNWNERQYFSVVEEKRRRTGCHIDVNKQELFRFGSDRFSATPGSRDGAVSKSSLQLGAYMTSQGNRVVLSGIGGDEVTGGVPTPIPELEDLLASFRFRQLAHQLKVWAINKRKPWLHLFFETARGFAPSSIVGMPKHMRPAPWLNRNFVKRNRTALQGYETRFKLFGSPPSFQENISTFDGLRRQLTCDCPHSEPLYEKRYPYLDRELLEFLYAIPREQLVRPGQRRSLMRRALVGIVPDKLLSRKRKGFVVRGPIAAVSAEWASLVGISRHMICTSLGIVDEDRLSKVLNEARQGQEVLIVTLTRTLRIEAWLRNLNARGILASTELRRQQPMKALAPNAMSD